MKGELLWSAHVFVRPAPQDKPETWKYRVIQKSKDDVVNPPAGWEPDRTFVKRAVHFNEPDPTNEYVVAHLEQLDVPLDPDPHGTPLDSSIIEVRAATRKLMVVNVRFMNRAIGANQFAEITMETVDPDGNPTGSRSATFACDNSDIKKLRTWFVSPAPLVPSAQSPGTAEAHGDGGGPEGTGAPEPTPCYRYRYRVKVTDFEEGSEWELKEWVYTDQAFLHAVIPPKNSPHVNFRFKKAT